MTRIINRKIVVLGGKPLSARCLRRLHAHHAAGEIEIVGVITRPPGARGWWSAPGVPEMRETAEQLGLPLLGGEDDLLDLDFDLGLSILHFNILRAAHIRRARNAFLNLHCAPLPHYRGCNACSHAIINGETRFGATLHHMDERVDHGDVIRVAWFDIAPDMTARTLMAAVEQVAYDLFCAMLPAILANDLPATPQRELIAREGIVSRYHARDSLARPEVKRIDPAWPAETILRRVRALDFPPFEPAYMLLGGCKVHLTTDRACRPTLEHRDPVEIAS